jgi:SatD family (SatD)
VFGVALIGDLVGSRRSPDRDRLQAALVNVLHEANTTLDPLQPLEVTLGDEFQGVFRDPAAALAAALQIRLALLASDHGGDSRYGLGIGTIRVWDAAASLTSQDGPGWWAGRRAIERAKVASDSPRTEYVRTAIEAWSDDSEHEREALLLDAFAMERDAMIWRMTPRGQRLLLGLLRGELQADVAAREGITQGAVSQYLHRSGAFGIQSAQQRLRQAYA